MNIWLIITAIIIIFFIVLFTFCGISEYMDKIGYNKYYKNYYNKLNNDYNNTKTLELSTKSSFKQIKRYINLYGISRLSDNYIIYVNPLYVKPYKSDMWQVPKENYMHIFISISFIKKNDRLIINNISLKRYCCKDNEYEIISYIVLKPIEYLKLSYYILNQYTEYSSECNSKSKSLNNIIDEYKGISMKSYGQKTYVSCNKIIKYVYLKDGSDIIEIVPRSEEYYE